MTAPPTWRWLAMSVLVALGVTVACAGVAILFLSIYESANWDSGTYQSVMLTPAGEPVIVSGGLAQPTIVTLAGQSSDAAHSTLGHVQYIPPPQSGERFMTQRAWHLRLAATNDQQPSPTYWYLLHDGETPGRAYGIGYDARRRRVVGYYGRSGFMADPPTPSDRFVVSGTSALSGKVPFTTDREPVSSIGSIQYLLADDQLYAIDVRQRAVRPVIAVPQVATLGSVCQVGAVVRPDATGEFTPPPLVVRTDEVVHVVDRRQVRRATVTIPEDLRNAPLGIALLDNGQTLLIGFPAASQGRRQAAIWLAADGREARREEFPAVNRSADDGQLATNVLSLFSVPSAAGQLTLAALGGALFASPSGESTTPWNGMWEILAVLWPALAATTILGSVTALLTWRRQQRYAEPASWGWIVFVFLAGLPGWIAYRWHRDWPPLGDCPECGQPTRLDTSHCTQCGAHCSAPRTLGTEIFA